MRLVLITVLFSAAIFFLQLLYTLHIIPALLVLSTIMENIGKGSGKHFAETEAKWQAMRAEARGKGMHTLPFQGELVAMASFFYASGYSQGCNDGGDSGYNLGYGRGVRIGYDQGYDHGFSNDRDLGKGKDCGKDSVYGKGHGNGKGKEGKDKGHDGVYGLGNLFAKGKEGKDKGHDMRRSESPSDAEAD